MLGRNQFALRKGFAKGKTLYALRAPHPYGWVPIAGMTDPFAIEQFSRLFIPTAWSVK